MIYLSEHDICQAGIDWPEIHNAILEAIRLVHAGDFAQPVKPYLRYRNPRNRIIAMPAYAGGPVSIAGIKWIASFPGNVELGLPRAHSVTILNEESTGRPVCIINTARISAIRTAGVTAVVIGEYLRSAIAPSRPPSVGIIGFGPIGQMHAEMCSGLFAGRIGRITVYDPRCLMEAPDPDRWPGLDVAACWEDVYRSADILITATVSDNRYINLPPRPGSLYCNISLRDFQSGVMERMDRIIVDDWDEVCREKTDIHHLNEERKLFAENVFSFTKDPLESWLDGLDKTGSVMFNPMGMAVFDICVGKHYYEIARCTGTGTVLEREPNTELAPERPDGGFLW
jgi:ornithine cyclodeaminase